MRVHEWVQVGIAVSCSSAQARHEREEGQEAQEPQEQQKPRPLQQRQRPLPRPSPAPAGDEGRVRSGSQSLTAPRPGEEPQTRHLSSGPGAAIPEPCCFRCVGSSLHLLVTQGTVQLKPAEATRMCQARQGH